MRRFVTLVSVSMLMLIALVALRAGPGAGAQDATPATGMGVEGVTVEPLAAGPVPAYPPLPAEIDLARVRIAPGSRIVTPADDPGLSLVYVESGTVVLARTVANVVTRGSAMATPGANAQEQIPANTEVTLGAGDFYLAPPVSGGELRNDGTEEATILVAGIAQPMAATPTP